MPSTAYYGIHYAASGGELSHHADADRHLPGPDINALACIKQAVALANHEPRLLTRGAAGRHRKACAGRLRAGRWHDQFVVDVYPGRRGHLHQHERQRGDREPGLGVTWASAASEYEFLHPMEHVNMGQSTNDVYPTALKVATYFSIFSGSSTRSASVLRRGFEAKAEERPRRGQDGADAAAGRRPDDPGAGVQHLRRHARRGRGALKEAALLILEINMGAPPSAPGFTGDPRD